jgi:hypothetical protein
VHRSSPLLRRLLPGNALRDGRRVRGRHVLWNTVLLGGPAMLPGPAGHLVDAVPHADGRRADLPARLSTLQMTGVRNAALREWRR